MITNSQRLLAAALILLASSYFTQSAAADETEGSAPDSYDGAVAVSDEHLARIGNPSHGLRALPSTLNDTASADACSSAVSCGHSATTITIGAAGQNVVVRSYNTTSTASATVTQNANFGSGIIATGGAR